MRLSVVFELLLIFVLIAFAASRVIEPQNELVAQPHQTIRKVLAKQEVEMNKYCTCSENFCNCCREFRVPIVNINGPGCAVLRYEADDNLGITLSFADRVIAQRVLSGRKPRPVCMPLPGGFSKFCGRVYNIGRAGEEFKACLGLELQSSETVEAAVRVSCFKFGPRGVTTEEADPLPLATEQVSNTDDDEDDELGFGGFGTDGEDDDDDDDDDEDDDDDDDDDDDEDDDDEEDDDDDDDDAGDATDYTGFSILDGLFESGSSGTKKPIKKKTQLVKPAAAVVQSKPTSKPSSLKRKPTKAPAKKQPVKVSVSVEPQPSTDSVDQVPQKIDTSKNASALNLMHTSALLQLTNKPSDDVNEVGSSDNNVVSMEPVPLIKRPARPLSDSPAATTLQDLGIQSSISYITGQLSDAQAGSIIASTQSMLNNKIPVTESPSKYKPQVVSSDEDIESKESEEDSAENDYDDDSKEDDNDDYDDSDEKGSLSQRKKGSSTPTKIKKKDDKEDDDILGFEDLSALTESLGFGQPSKKKKKNSNTSSTTPSSTTTKKKKKNEGILSSLSSITGALGLARSRQNRVMNH